MKVYPTIVLLAVASLAGSAAHAAPPASAAAAEALFEEGRAALQRGDLGTACARFRASNEIERAAGTLLNLAECEERRGHLASAWEAFRAAREKLAAGDDRIPFATARAEALEPRLPRVRVTLAPGAPAGTTAKEAELSIGAATFGVALPLDPGAHRLVVSAPGRVARTYEAELVAGETLALDIEPGPPEGASPPGGPHDASAPSPPTTLSHAGQFGALARADIDGLRAGVVLAFGLTYGIGDHVEVSAAALVGKSKGVEPAVAVLFLAGAIKPRLTVGAPIYFVDGARPGVHPAAGVQWDPIRHFGLFADVGASFFPAAPVGFDKVVFVPSVGAQGRL